MPKATPERTCIVTRTVGGPDDFLRFVLGPEGEVVPDLRGRLPGRGAWVTPTRGAVADAVRRKLFGRAFRAEVRAPPDLPDRVDALMVRDVAGALALANKAGAVVAGFGKVEAAARAGGVAALVHAREAAEDGRRKLRGALRGPGGDPISDPVVLDDLPEDDLDVALGRQHVIHAALLAGPGSQGCLARWQRLRSYRGAAGGAEHPRDAGERPDLARTSEPQD